MADPLADPDVKAWQAANAERIHRRMATVRDEEDGPLFTAVWSGYFVVVTKADDHLRLWLMEETAENTEWVQSVLNIDHPLRLVLGYTQAMMLALIWQPEPQRVLVSGLGGGCLPLVLHHHLPTVQIDCAEIAPPVIAAAIEWFPLPQDKRLQIQTADASAFLAAQTPDRYDILFLDLFGDGGSTPAHLTTVEFFQLCHDRLRADGVLTMNLYRGAEDHTARLDRLRQTFQTVYVCQIHDTLNVVFATDQPRQSSFQLVQQATAQQQRRRFHFRFVEWITRFID
jgi:spermidine synthase